MEGAKHVRRKEHHPRLASAGDDSPARSTGAGAACKVGYRARRLVNLARKLDDATFPTMADLKEESNPDEAKKRLLELPGIGDYSADIINPNGGYPIGA